jgi:hypothetical protein
MESLLPDYSGGTAPDLHRLPFYALAGTQDLAKRVYNRTNLNCQSDETLEVTPLDKSERTVKLRSSLNQLTANEIHHDAGEESCWMPIFKRTTRFGAEIVLVRLKIEPLSE